MNGPQGLAAAIQSSLGTEDETACQWIAEAERLERLREDVRNLIVWLKPENFTIGEQQAAGHDGEPYGSGRSFEWDSGTIEIVASELDRIWEAAA